MIITDASVIGCRSLEAESENLKEPLFPSGTDYGYIRVNFRSASGRSQNDSGAEKGAIYY